MQSDALHELLQLSSHSILSLRHQNTLLSARQATLQASHKFDAALHTLAVASSSRAAPSSPPRSTRLQAQCTALRAQLSDAQSRTTHLSKLLEEANARVTALTEQLSRRGAKLDELAQRRVHDQRHINTLTQNEHRLTTQLEQMQQQLQASVEQTVPARFNEARLLSPAPLAVPSPSESRSRYTDTMPFDEDAPVEVHVGELQRTLDEHVARADVAHNVSTATRTSLSDDAPRCTPLKRKRAVSVTPLRRSPRQTLVAARANRQSPPKRSTRRKTWRNKKRSDRSSS